MGLASCNRRVANASAKTAEYAIMACSVSNEMSRVRLPEIHRRKHASSVLHLPVPP